MLPTATHRIFAGDAEWVTYMKTVVLGNAAMLYEEIRTLPVNYWVE